MVDKLFSEHDLFILKSQSVPDLTRRFSLVTLEDFDSKIGVCIFSMISLSCHMFFAWMISITRAYSGLLNRILESIYHIGFTKPSLMVSHCLLSAWSEYFLSHFVFCAVIFIRSTFISWWVYNLFYLHFIYMWASHHYATAIPKNLALTYLARSWLEFSPKVLHLIACKWFVDMNVTFFSVLQLIQFFQYHLSCHIHTRFS